jgi:glycosyltransferase involved in cell wall biosynthesis
MERKETNSRILWVGFLIVDLFLYGTTQLEILKNLARLGHSVDLLALYSRKKPTSPHKEINIESFPLRYVPGLTAFFFAIIVMTYLPFYVVRKRPKFIIVEPDFSILVFLWKPLLNLLDAKIVLDIRSTPVEVVDFRRYVSALWFNVSIIAGKKAFDGMTILTSRMKQEVCDDFHIDPSHVGIWTSGVSEEIFAPEKYDRDEIRTELSWADKFVLMYHGSLGAHRGVTETIGAIEIAKKQIPNLLFFILGSGPALESMKKLVEEKHLDKNVIFHVPVPYEEVPRFIAACDVGIVPLPNLAMWMNQSPLKLLEYLAMKKATLLTDITMNREVVGNNVCGIYFSTATPMEIARAIIYSFDNRAKLAEWGDIGRTIIEEKYTWVRVAKGLETYLMQL